MKNRICVGLLCVASFCMHVEAQSYDLLIQGGHVIDPANSIDRVMDIAVSAGKIARVAERISATEAKKTVNVAGLYVTPGLIDIHTHVYVGGRPAAVFPDDAVLPTGTTTIVDAGVSGWRTFDDFKTRIIDKSRTRTRASPAGARSTISRRGSSTSRALAFSRSSTSWDTGWAGRKWRITSPIWILLPRRRR